MTPVTPATPAIAALITLYARCSQRLRRTVVLSGALAAAGKLFAVLTAVQVAAGDIRSAVAAGVAGVTVLAAARVAASSARVGAECDLQHAITRALLQSDVLASPTRQPLKNLSDPTFYARSLIAETAPELAANVVAALAVIPLLAATLPPRVLVLGGVAIAVVLAALATLRRLNAAVQRRVWDAQEKVVARVGFAVEGRLELVARGAEAATLRSLAAAIDRYRVVARRGGWGTALLGRAPLAAGLAAVFAMILVDASYREAVTSAVLAQALVLAACLPILLGVVIRASDLVRVSTMIASVLEVLGAPRRPELERAGEKPPELPAIIVAQGISFAYVAGGSTTLRGVSFEWRPGTALVVEGPNGAGKSTLLRLLLGLRTPQAGSLTVGGKDLAVLDLIALRHGIAYLPQRPYLGEAHSTVRSALRVVDDSASDDALTAALSRVGLADLLDAPVGELSAGQRQRLALARLLLPDAGVYLLDEPDANLDRAGVTLVEAIVAELIGRGRMVAIAAHSAELASIEGTRVRLG